MDGRGRFLDNIFIERLWRSLKYEAVYLHELRDGPDAERIIGSWIDFYNGPPGFQKLHGFPRGAPLRRAARPWARPDSTEPPIRQPGPFAYACDASELSAPSSGVVGNATPAGLSPLRHPSTPEAPSLDGRYPASSVLRAHPPPCRPGLPLAGFRLPRARHRRGFPCCYAFHLPCMPAPLPRRKPAGALVALFPAGRRPSPYLRRVGFRIDVFEACSAFTERSGPRGR